MPKIKVPKEKRRLLAYPDIVDMIQKTKFIRDKSLIALYYLTGCRCSEALNIKKEDIKIDDKWVYINIKRQKTRTKVLPKIDTLKIAHSAPFVHYIVEQHTYIRSGHPVWFYHDNLQTARKYVWKMIKKVNPNAWTHLFRHSRNEALRRKGFTTEQRMAWFGWKSANTANKYTHPDEKDIEKMGENLE